MPANLATDDSLIEEAVRIGHHKTKKAAVTIALNEYIQRRNQQKIVSLFGGVDYEPSYDYKEQRKRK